MRIIKIIRWLDNNLERYLVFLFYLYLVLIIFVEVFRRYVLGDSSMWGEETARYAFVWMTYLAAAQGVKDRSHLAIDTLIHLGGKKLKLFSYVLSDIAFLILSLIIVYYAMFPVLSNLENNVLMTGSSLPLALATIAVPVAWSLIIIRIIQRFILTIKEYKTKTNEFI